MSKKTNYSNTTIYKIVCKDTSVTGVYVGHTTNFSKRKYAHMANCNNITNVYANTKLYKAIRENGGWDNWDMLEIEHFECNNLTEARRKEQYYYELLNSTLNSISPFIEMSMVVGSQPNTIFDCKVCDFHSSSKNDFARHIRTNKHKIRVANKNKLPYVKGIYICDCKKQYADRSGLFKHKQKCSQIITSEPLLVAPAIDHSNNTIIMELLKQNKDFKDLIVEQNKQLLEQNNKIMELIREPKVITNNYNYINEVEQ